MPLFDLDQFLGAIEDAQQAAGRLIDPKSPEELEEWLTKGQVYLSEREVFAQEMVEDAFVSSDGLDLRGPLALRNLQAAIKLSNWVDSDQLIQLCWALQRDLPAKLRAIDGPRSADLDMLEGLFDRLTRENPTPATTQEALARYEEAEPPRLLGEIPASLWLDQKTQIALRLWWLTRTARDFTAAKLELREVWYRKASNEHGYSREQFERVFDVDLSGVSGVWRGLGIPGVSGGNFFQQIGKSISRLFRHPLKFLRSAAEEMGKGLQALAKPSQWLQKIPVVGYALGGILHPVLGELGRALEAQNINAFREQQIAYVSGMALSQAGQVVAFVGGILTAAGAVGCIPCAAIGPLLAAVGALAMAVGRSILALHQMVRMQRLMAEARLALPSAGMAVPQSQSQNSAMIAPAQAHGTGRSSSSGSGIGIVALLALFVLAR